MIFYLYPPKLKAMDLKNLMAISGKPGLYRLINPGKNSVIVENIETEKRMPTYATQRISTLEEISVFTKEEDIPLKEVLIRIHEKENGEQLINLKDWTDATLREYFTDVMPDHDPLRVYVSDIRKMMSWYNLLKEFSDVEWKRVEVAELEEVDEVDEVEDGG